MSSTVASDTSTGKAPLELADLAKSSGSLHEYVVSMKSGHTVSKHFEYLKEILPCLAKIEDQYRAVLTEDERERVRNDPDVLKVLQSRMEVKDGAPKDHRKVLIPHGYDVAPGFSVMFANVNDYTMDQHFARIGFKLEEYEIIDDLGYHSDMLMEQAEAIIRDPMVDCVQQNSLGEYS